MTYTLAPPLPETATPGDYARVHFDPANLPAKRIVGLLACQRDPLLRALSTRVVAAQPAATAPVAQKGRQKKKGANANGANGTNGTSGTNTPAESGTVTPLAAGTLWEVELEDTVVFPEGGGQPWDTGRLVFGGKEFVVEGCIRRGLDAVHLVRIPEGTAFVSPGDEVEIAVDWERRADHMAMHTGQHLLSAVLDARQLPTLSWAMDPYPSLAAGYVELPRGLTWAEAEEVERECNAHIGINRRIWIDFTVQQCESVVDEARRSEVERENRAIPKDYTGGIIRHCNIDGIDRNACCGTQCPDLSLVNYVHVIPPSTRWDATEPSSKAATRLYFVSGPRALRHFASASRSLSRAGQAIGVGRELVVERVTRLETNRYDTAEKEKALRLELARTLGEAAKGGEHAAYVHRYVPATHDFEFLNTIAGAYFDKLADDEVSDGREEDKSAAIVVTSAPPNANPALLLVQARDHDKGKRLFEEIKSAIAGEDKTRVKGGGARGRFMAKIEKWGGRDTIALKGVLGLP